MTLHLRIFNAKHLTPYYKDGTKIKGLYCVFCVRDNDSHRAKDLKKPQTLFYHLHQCHQKEIGFDFILEILKHVSFAKQLRML